MEEIKTPVGAEHPGEPEKNDKKELTTEELQKLLDDTKKESIQRKEKLRAISDEKSELEKKLKEYEDIKKAEEERKLKEKEDYKNLVELKNKELEKIQSEFDPLKKELEDLRKLKVDIETKEKARRETLLENVKAISEKAKNESMLSIAEALPTDRLEIYLKQISEQKEKTPVFSGKPSIKSKPEGEVKNAKDYTVTELQDIYKSDKARYDEIMNERRK